MHTWYTQNTPTGKLHVLRTPKHSSVRLQPTHQTWHSQSLTPPKTNSPKPNQTPKIFVPFPERILQSPQVKTLLPKVTYQLSIESSYYSTMSIPQRHPSGYHLMNDITKLTYHKLQFVTYVRTWVYLRMSHRRSYVPGMQGQTTHKMDPRYIYEYVSSSSRA